MENVIYNELRKQGYGVDVGIVESFKRDENGKLQGYEYDIWQEVNKNLKSYHLDIQAVPPETQDVMMESGDAKVASGGYYRTPRREKD